MTIRLTLAAGAIARVLGTTVLVAAAAIAPAYGQTNGGWTLNIDNTGFNPMPAGGLLPYSIRIDNNGNTATPPTTVAFTIPASTIFTGITGLANCLPLPDADETVLAAPLSVTCDVPALSPNAVLNAKVNLRPMTAGTVELTGKLADPGPSFSRKTTVELGADLAVTLTADPTTVQAGSTAQFSAVVTNNGPYPAQGAKLVLPLPTGMSPDVTMPAGCAYTAPNITCEIPGPIASGATVKLDFATQVTTANASTITIAAAITSNGPRDPINTNNDASTDIAVTPGTDVSLDKRRAPAGLILVGDEVTFTLEPRVSGVPPTQASISDILPANYEYVSVAASNGWTCPTVGQTIGCVYAAAPGTNYTSPITVVARAITATAPDSGVTNTASITSDDENSGAGGNNAANDGEAFIAEPRIDLVAQKSGPPRGLVTVGNPYDFLLSTRNDGNKNFSGPLTIIDHLPAGLTLTGVSAPGWICNPTSAVGPADIVCTTSMYTPGSPLRPTQQTTPIVISTMVTGTGSLSNGMTVPFDTYPDANTSNNTTTSHVDSADNLNWADISVLKTLNPDPGPVTAGDPVTFRIEIVNAGPGVATSVVLDDRLNDIVANADGGVPGPADITFGFTDGLATGMTCSTPTSSGYSRDLKCLIDSLPVCVAGSGNCPVVSVTVRPGSQGIKQNTAIAFSTVVPDNSTANNSASVNYTVTPRTDVTITKISPAAASGSAAGQELTYVLAAGVPRNGLSDAQDVTVEDELPIGLRFVSAVPSAGSCSVVPTAGTITGVGNRQLTCNLGTITNGAQQTVTVRVIPTSSLIGSSIRNEASVSTSTPETDPDNNTDDVTVLIKPPELDLIISKTDGPDPVMIDTDTHYTITVRNSGPSDAFNLEITDTLPTSGLANPRVAVPPAGGSCTTAGTSTTVPGGTLTCTVPYLAANSSVSFIVDMLAVGRGRHTNNVTVTSDETRGGYEAPDDNNSSYEDTTVRVRSDLEVTKVPSVATVDLREKFSWTITVRNKVTPGLGIDVAEWVTLVDTLPEGMELTALPVTSAGSCVGVIGGRDITCDLGDIAAGAAVTITLETKITSISAQSAANSATASTLSFDIDEGNNTGTGRVNTVLGSSISGTIYRDFDANDTKDAVDTGMAGVTIHVDGIALHDGSTITRQFTTVDGTYNFTELPPGTYSVFYTTIGEKHLIDGKALPGTGAGTAVAAGVNRINSIVVTNAINGTKHDFTRVPVARIGLGKVAGTPVVQTGGSYHIPYTLTVRNYSLEPVTGITVSDVLNGTVNGVSQNFGTNSGSAEPAEGQYRIISVSSNFGSLNSGFDGAGNNTILANGTLAAGATGTLTVTIHVNPVVPRIVPALVHTNQAQISGNGQHSGQAVTDLSHNNSNPDPDGNGIPNEPANNTPTTVTPEPTRSIALIKTPSFTPAGSAAAVGEVVTYSFTVTNTGNTPLVNVTLTDPLPGLVWVSNTPIPRLNPGQVDTTTFRASYTLTQADLDRGNVPNTASVAGQWGINGVTPQTVTGSSSATVPALSKPGLTLLKELESSTVGNPRTEVGNTIRYKFTVTNTGNTTLRNVIVGDALAGVTADPAGAFSIGTMAPQTSKVVYANYAVQLKDINAGSVVNSATANGVHGPGNTAITTPPSAVTVPLYRQPGMSLTKSLTSTVPAMPLVGSVMTWRVTATNTGNVTLTNLVVSDPFPGASVTPASHPTLLPGASFDFTVSAPLNQGHINAEEVRNRAKVDFVTPGGPGTPVDSNEVVTPLPAQAPAIALKKTGDITGLSNPPQQGDEILYTIVIRNTGNIPLNNIVLVDLLADVVLDPADLSILNTTVLQPQNAAGNATGTEVTVKASYALKTSDIEAGAVINTAVVTGVSTVDPGQTVTDRGGTTFGTDDPTTTFLDRAPTIGLVKTITTAALSTPPQAGDVITYGFAVHNTGNVTLNDIVLTELVSGVTVLNPSGWTGPLAAGASNSTAFTATYALTQADIDRGNFANSAEVAGMGPGPGGAPTRVTDISGTDITNDVPTDQLLTRTSALSIVKSHSAALSTPSAPGDVITYSFVVTNTGNVTLTNVVVSDPLADLVMPVTTIATLLPGATNAVTLTATYALKQADIEAGEVRNTASVTGTYTDPVTGPQIVPPVPSNEVVVPLDRHPAIALVKSAVSGLSDPAVVGEVITYSFTVTNTGNLDLTLVEINDPLPGLTPNRFVVGNLAPATSQTFTATYAIVQADIDRGEVVNQATATGTSIGGPATDLSGPTITTDEPVVVPVLPEAPGMTIAKSGTFANGGGYTRVGDVIDYSFVVTNTGNVPLDNVTPRELLLTFGGIAATGATTPITPGPLTLAVGAQATFTTQYVVTQDDINRSAGIADGVSNTADATATYGVDPITATQDTAVLSIPPQEPADITISKRALVSTIRRGDTVPYLIVIKNNSLADVGLVTITDRIPAGFVFVDGSATVNDVPITPVVGGRDVRFDRVALGPNSEVRIGLVLRALASTPPGKYRNIVEGVDALGTSLAPPAHADVLIEAEGVFDCSEVIGTVFDDLNHNGYQDEGEPGIAGVRLSTVRGTLITTDAFGRFSVPCADLPNGNIGSNFVLKLDDRTLPTGYALTTDNPAMVRLTAGKMVEMNFGASLGREIRFGLDAAAFISGSTATAPALDGGIDQVMALLGEHTTVLTITYTAGSGDQLARQRVEHIAALIRERWRQAGAPYRLIINTDIVER